MKIKDIIALAFTGVLVLCALTITGLVIRQEFFAPEPKPEVRQIKNWEGLAVEGSKVGPEKATVQIIEFFDYQCPYCKSVQPAVKKIQEKYPDDIQVQYAHFPLGGHEYAYEAAVAAECAARQNKFSRYHTLLFDKQDQLGKITYQQLAVKAGIKDVARFRSCISNAETGPVVESGLSLADRLEVKAIPTFVINGRLVSGALSEARLEKLTQEALNER